MSDDAYEDARDELVVELNREPTYEEIENAMADKEAVKIDAAYEQARADGRITF